MNIKCRIRLAIILLCICVTKSYAYDFEYDGLYYNITSDQTVCVTYKTSELNPRTGFYVYSTDVEGDVIIPKYVTYNSKNYSVTKIGHNAFRNATNLTSIIIPSTVDSIGGTSCLQGCENLKKIYIPSTVKYIGGSGFSDCGLVDVELPDSLSIISMNLFQNSKLLTSVIIPKKVTVIEEIAFGNCTSLKSVSIPESVTTIGSYAFGGCTGLENIIIPQYVNKIDSRAFKNCSGLKTVDSRIKQPFEIKKDVFEGLADATLQVPYGTLSEYQKYDGWISNFKEIIEAESEDIFYKLSISSVNGTVSYNNISVTDETKTFDVNAGASVSLKLTPKNGYMIKSVIVNGVDATNLVSNEAITIKAINSNTTIDVEFTTLPSDECILTINAKGPGSISFGEYILFDNSASFSVKRNTSIALVLNLKQGYWIKKFTINSIDMVAGIINNEYKINSIDKDIIVDVEFAEEYDDIVLGDITYSISSFKDRTLLIKTCRDVKVLNVPSTIDYDDVKWFVTGIGNDVLSTNNNLAAIIWEPKHLFNTTIYNKNTLLYVTSAEYAPAMMTNVIVNGEANIINLIDASDNGDFYCPQEFTAKSISYTHNYGMQTGIGESKGWDTIVLPYDVQKITHSSKGELKPYSSWEKDERIKPFWLMEYGSEGWKNANSIKANTPYIISMPNHTNYKTEFRVNGNITFSSENVVVKATDNLTKVTNGNQSFVPNYTNQDDESFYVLNVNNDFVSYNGEYVEGSRFIKGLRSVRPFEAYMTSSSNSTRSIPISDNMTTGIEKSITSDIETEMNRIYNLQGQQINVDKSYKETMRDLPAGVYIVNGKKLIIK